jgi:putative transcriptional regulator
MSWGTNNGNNRKHVVWRLRLVAAERGVWTGARLRRLLAEEANLRLSPASISALMTKQPKELKLRTLGALCQVLHCTPNDLLTVTDMGRAEVDLVDADAPATTRPYGAGERQGAAAGRTG